MRQRRAIRPNRADRAFNAAILILCVLTFIIICYPLYFVLIASISNATKVLNGEVFLLPVDINFNGYREVITDARIGTGYINTLIYTLAGTAINMLVTLPAAYTLSRPEFRARRALNLFFVFTMFFSGGMIATYLVIKQLNLLNSRLVFMLPFCINVYNLMIVRSFFESSLPEELHEAAVLDGCGHVRYFVSFVLPLSKAVIAVISLYYMVAHWNDFFTGLLYIRSGELLPLQNILRSILLANQTSAAGSGASFFQLSYQEQIKYAVIIVSTLPLLVLYPFLQKYFDKGVMLGAVKG